MLTIFVKKHRGTSKIELEVRRIDLFYAVKSSYHGSWGREVGEKAIKEGKSLSGLHGCHGSEHRLLIVFVDHSGRFDADLLVELVVLGSMRYPDADALLRVQEVEKNGPGGSWSEWVHIWQRNYYKTNRKHSLFNEHTDHGKATCTFALFLSCPVYGELSTFQTISTPYSKTMGWVEPPPLILRSTLAEITFGSSGHSLFVQIMRLGSKQILVRSCSWSLSYLGLLCTQWLLSCPSRPLSIVQGEEPLGETL